MPDLSFLGTIGPYGLTLSAIVAIIFIFAKWIFPTLESNKANLVESHKKLDSLIQENIDMEKKLTQINFETLKNQIRSESMNITDRIYASVRFLKLGGNSDTKIYIYNKLIPGNDDIWRMACKALEYEE